MSSDTSNAKTHRRKSKPSATDSTSKNPFSECDQESQKSIAQDLLKCRSFARSIESTLDAIQPLLDPNTSSAEIHRGLDLSSTLSDLMKRLYSRVARDAFLEDET